MNFNITKSSRLKKNAAFLGLLVLLSVLAAPAQAQRVPAADLMPPPKAAPRTPVKSEKLPDQTVREFVGQATALDGATISLQTFKGQSHDLRLAGLVQAPLTDSKGVAARVALDALMQARTLTCVRRDRASDGKIIATCRRDDGVDLGMQMLRDGITLYTRSGNLSEDFVRAYREAESLAQAEGRGLWANVPRLKTTAAKAAPRAVAPEATDTTVTVADKAALVPQQEQAPQQQAPQQPVQQQPAPNYNTGTAHDVLGELPAKTLAANVAQANAAATPTAEVFSGQISNGAGTIPVTAWGKAKESAQPTAAVQAQPEATMPMTSYFFAAALIGTLLLGVSLFDFLNRRRVRFSHEWEAKNTRQYLAAALSGELAAARDVCDSRARNIIQGGAPVWPRLRSYVFQAHVDKIGMLGPFLARQVATIYGQMADYSHTAKEEGENAEREETIIALQRLSSYMEVALEGLAEVEMTGEAPLPAIPADYQAVHHQRVVEARERRALTHQRPTNAAPAQSAPPAYRERHPRHAHDVRAYDRGHDRSYDRAHDRAYDESAAPRSQSRNSPARAAAPTRAASHQAPERGYAPRTESRNAPTTADYSAYGEAAAQRIMEDELIRRRAEELLRAKASPMRRRSMPPKEAFGDESDLHQPDLLGLDEEAVEYTEKAPRSTKRNG